MSKSTNNPSMAPLKIAVEGCGHGSLDAIYSSLEQACNARGWTVAQLDFLIICGDFQGNISPYSAVRNARDLNCMSIPRKYRQMGDFHRYYSGEKHAPVLTLVVGGNHEASNYFSELHHGGWLAPDIYYLGAVGVLRYSPLRIAGISGIFYRGDYFKPHHERLPYDRNEVRSIYHVRESTIGLGGWNGLEITRNSLPADRPHFFDSAKIDNLGSAPAEQVMNALRPRHWFSGHMHVKYSAAVEHNTSTATDVFKHLAVPEEIQSQLRKSMFRSAFKNKKSVSKPFVTNFLALDKPGPNREYLELLEIDYDADVADTPTSTYMQKTSEGKFALYYDEDWLSIIRSSGDRLGASHVSSEIAAEESDAGHSKSVSQSLHWIQANLTAKGLLKIPDNFEKHAPVYDPTEKVPPNEQPCEYPNSQTEQFCRMLQIRNASAVDEIRAQGDDYIVFE